MKTIASSRPIIRNRLRSWETGGSGSIPVNDVLCIPFTVWTVGCPVKRNNIKGRCFCLCLTLLFYLPSLLCLGVAGTSGPFNVLEVILIRFHTVSTGSLSPPFSISLHLHLLCSSFYQPSIRPPVTPAQPVCAVPPYTPQLWLQYLACLPTSKPL